MSQELIFNLDVDNSAAVSSINTFFDAWENGVKSAGQMLDKQFSEKSKVIGLKLEGGKIVAKEIENIATISNRAKKATAVLNGEFGKTPKAVKRSVAVLKELLNSTKKYKDGTKKLTEEWKILSRRLKEAKEIMKGMRVDPQLEKSITGANIAAGLALDAIRALGRAVMGFIKEGIQMEVLMLQLEGFTGSTEEARDAFDEFTKIAVDTPFNVKQVTEAARTMMGFGVSTDEAIQRVEQLAIVAASTDGELKNMARNLGQIQANQKAYTRDLMQFANQGIPIYQMLGEVLGVSTQQIREMAEEGRIGYAEVTAALDLMTKEGSAFQVIADKMGRTMAARLEEMGSAITEVSGQFINMIQSIDAAVGGPLEKSMQLISNIIRMVGDGFQNIGKNAETLAPIFVALGTVMAGTLGTALILNLKAIGAQMVLLIAKAKTYAAVQAGLVVIQKILAALTGNWGRLALAAGVAVVAFETHKRVTRDLIGEQKAATEAAKQHEEALAAEARSTIESADAGKLLVFQTKELTGATKKLVKEEKEKFKDNQRGYKLQLSAMERTMAYLTRLSDEEKKQHTDKIENIKEEMEIEKTKQTEAIAKAKERHEIVMTNLRAEKQEILDKYDIALGLLDEETVYSKELKQIKKREIEEKLRSNELSRKETLELLEQLEQMKRQEKRKDLLAKKAEEVRVVEEKIKKEQEKQEKAMDKIKDQYEDRIKVLEKNMVAEEESINKIDKKLEAQSSKVRQFKDQELTAIYENRDAALSALDDQIAKAGVLRTAMREAYAEAKRANAEAAKGGPDGTRASGGPVLGGSTYQVNERGKEAFLSASGKLSMINAPAFGNWRAPSSGTVIPAHLTSQLAIPSGGVNLNQSAGMAASSSSGGSDLSRAFAGFSGGDNITNNVTIQSANPNQTASDVMVQLAKLKRVRYN